MWDLQDKNQNKNDSNRWTISQKTQNSPKQIGWINHPSGLTRKQWAWCFRVYWPYVSQFYQRFYLRKVHKQNPKIWFWESWRVNHLCGLSAEEPCRIECHYCSTHVQVHRKGAERRCQTEYCQKANFVGSCAVANFTMVIATMTVHILPTYTYCNQRQYMQRYLRKNPDIKVQLTIRLIYLNTNLH